jgi:hypothetical protein
MFTIIHTTPSVSQLAINIAKMYQYPSTPLSTFYDQFSFQQNLTKIKL